MVLKRSTPLPAARVSTSPSKPVRPLLSCRTANASPSSFFQEGKPELAWICIIPQFCAFEKCAMEFFGIPRRPIHSAHIRISGEKSRLPLWGSCRPQATDEVPCLARRVSPECISARNKTSFVFASRGIGESTCLACGSGARASRDPWLGHGAALTARRAVMHSRAGAFGTP